MFTYIDNKVLTILKVQKLISDDQVASLAAEFQRTGESLATILIGRGVIAEEDLLKILSKEFHLPVVDLKSADVKDVAPLVPVKFASHYQFVPTKFSDGIMTIAVSYPIGVKTQDEIGAQLGYRIETVLASQSDITALLKEHYGLSTDAINRLISRKPSSTGESSASRGEKIEDIDKSAEEESVTNIVNQIILEAYKRRASDIHIEPYRGEVKLRYRVDGILYNAPVPSETRSFYSSILSRFKIMSNLDIVERRLPQDGRAVVKVKDHVLDLRISTVPTPHDESLVIRMLPTTMLFSLEKLGLSAGDLATFKQLIEKPYGIIFITGPTGSGKTTTLYTCLSAINTDSRKIVTIEDPIEYELKGVTQMQVSHDIGLTFARGLRSVLRHDPDVIMVGEVRDLETAEIAIRTALTGHLVFSTLHTNDAPSAVVRLMDIGVGAYLIASSVQAFVAQRLLRLICPSCKTEDTTVTQAFKQQVARELYRTFGEPLKFYKGTGCKACNGTGYRGRTAVYEILVVDETMRELISRRASSSELKKAALARGMHTLRQDGLRKALEGLTTIEEVLDLATTNDPEAHSAVPAKKVSDIPGLVDMPAEIAPGVTDKRVYRRVKTKINISYRLLKAPGKNVRSKQMVDKMAITEDISAGGVLFISDEAMDPGSILELKMELPDTGLPLECLAKVMSLGSYPNDGREFFKVGICFLDLSGAEHARLDKYVQEGLNREPGSSVG